MNKMERMNIHNLCTLLILKGGTNICYSFSKTISLLIYYFGRGRLLQSFPKGLPHVFFVV